MKINTRSYYVPAEMQIRAVGDQGIFEGHAVIWDVVDSHGTRFKKGSFTKTLKERGDKIKILDNHNVDEPIGKPLEMREDDIGLFVRGQLIEGVQKADEMRKKIDAEVIDTLSVGFNIVQDKPNGAVRDITEVKLYEFSPVTFASNEKAKITGFRSEDLTIVEPDNEPVKKVADNPVDNTRGKGDTKPEEDKDIKLPNVRATDFDESLKGQELYARQWLLMDSLHTTLGDIWWSEMSNDEMLAAFDTALATFHNQYLAWANEFISSFWQERHALMADKELAGVFNFELRKAEETIDSLATKTSLTANELRTLSRGDLMPIESRQKLTELPDAIQVAHQGKRRSMIESLCNELRAGGINLAEAARLKALLGVASINTEHRDEMTGALETLAKFRAGISSEK